MYWNVCEDAKCRQSVILPYGAGLEDTPVQWVFLMWYIKNSWSGKEPQIVTHENLHNCMF